MQRRIVQLGVLGTKFDSALGAAVASAGHGRASCGCYLSFLGGKEEEHGGKHSSESTAAGIYDLIYDIYGHRYDLDVASFGYAWICVILTQSSTDCL